MNQLGETRFVSMPESQAFFIVVHVKVFVKLLQGRKYSFWQQVGLLSYKYQY